MASIADRSFRHGAKKSVGPNLPNTTRATRSLHADLGADDTRISGGSREVHRDNQNKHQEREGWEFERQKEIAVRHRSASSGSGQRLNSWQQPPSSAQESWNNRQKEAAAKRKDVSNTEKMARHRKNQMDAAKMRANEFSRKQTMKMNEQTRADGLRGLRGDDHDDRRSGRKFVDEKNYHDDVASGRTAALKSQFKKAAVVHPSKVEHSSTHRTHGHLSDAEMKDYMGLKQGEELDEEGRVVPPWAVQEMRAQRYLGPIGEDYTSYNADFPGVDVEAAAEWSSRAPPPQMYLRDDRGKNVRRTDPRLPHDPAGYGQPFLGPYARLYESPAAISSGYGYPSIAGAHVGYPYGAGYGPAPGFIGY